MEGNGKNKKQTGILNWYKATFARCY